MRCFRSSAGQWLLLAAVAVFASSECRAAQASDGWADRRMAGPFVCRADFPLESMEGLLGELAQLQEDLGATLGVPAADQWIELYLFHDESTYRWYLKEHFPDLPYRRALYVKRDGPGIVLAYRSRELEVDLRHECTHALLHAVLPVVPLWLDEGLAEYFEVAPGQRAFDNPYLSKIRWRNRLGMTPQLANLEKQGDVEDMGAAEYRDAWAWVHFMLHGPAEAGDELKRFLADLQAHTPPGVFSQRLERRLPGLQRRFSAHFRDWDR
jgi:hypothetical protein